MAVAAAPMPFVRGGALSRRRFFFLCFFFFFFSDDDARTRFLPVTTVSMVP